MLLSFFFGCFLSLLILIWFLNKGLSFIVIFKTRVSLLKAKLYILRLILNKLIIKFKFSGYVLKYILRQILIYKV